MATSKTLTPTNVTIQIPAFADKPDQRLNSNCIDKEADAINALSDKIELYNIQVNSAWKDCPIGRSKWYFYETDNAGKTTYDLPSVYCFVNIAKYNNSRGIAIAYSWVTGAQKMWMNKLHDSWQGWEQVIGA